MPSAANAASKITTPPAITGARSSTRPGSLSVPIWPCSISASRSEASEAGVMPSSEKLHRLHHRADRLGGAGRAVRILPAGLAVVLGELLQQHADFAARALPALAGDLAAGEETQGRGDAAGLHALGVQRRQAAADDEFGAAAADVDHQPRFARGGQVVRGAEEDQAAFLAAGDHFDRMAQRGFGGGQEGLRRGQPAHGVGGDRAHPHRRQAGDALAEAGQAGHRAGAPFGVQACRRRAGRRPCRTVSRRRSITRGSPCSMRATTMWKLLEPMSTAAISSPSRIGVCSAGLTPGSRDGKARILACVREADA